jgi:hypothetical protein
MLENIKARLFAKRFNIWTEREDPNSKEGYWVYKNNIYMGHPLLIFFKSSQNQWFHNIQDLDWYKKKD